MQSPSSNDIASSLTTPLLQPASRDQSCCATIIGTHRHPCAPGAGEWSMCKLISLLLAIIRPHRSSPDRVRQCVYPEGQWSTDQSRSEVGVRALAMSSLSNSSKPRTSCDRVGLGPWLLGSQQRSRARDACRRPLGRLDRSEVRTATRIRDLTNGSSNRHSACDFPSFNGAGFRTHRHAGRLAGHAGDP